MDNSWQQQVASVWATADDLGEAGVVAAIDALVAQRGEADATALFEAASARDYAGLEPEAEPLYRRAVALGLDEPERGRAVIQWASTLRNLGRADEAITVLQDGFADSPGHPLTDAARAFLALCLVDTGDATAAAAVALDALADHLPEYTRSVRAYANELTQRAE